MCELNEDDILRVVSANTRNVLDDGNSVDGDTAPILLRDNWPESRSLRTTRAVTHARLERRRRRSQKIAHRAMQVKLYMNLAGAALDPRTAHLEGRSVFIWIKSAITLTHPYSVFWQVMTNQQYS